MGDSPNRKASSPIALSPGEERCGCRSSAVLALSAQRAALGVGAHLGPQQQLTWPGLGYARKMLMAISGMFSGRRKHDPTCFPQGQAAGEFHEEPRQPQAVMVMHLLV